MEPIVSNVTTTAGTTLAVCESLPATYDVTGYEALSYTDISEITDFGEFGRSYQEVTHESIGRRGVVKRKGNYNDGNLNLALGRDVVDAGQIILNEYVDLDDSLAFLITYQDGSKDYFVAQVFSFTNNIGSANQIVGRTVNLGIESGSIVHDTGGAS